MTLPSCLVSVFLSTISRKMLILVQRRSGDARTTGQMQHFLAREAVVCARGPSGSLPGCHPRELPGGMARQSKRDLWRTREPRREPLSVCPTPLRLGNRFACCRAGCVAALATRGAERPSLASPRAAPAGADFPRRAGRFLLPSARKNRRRQ